MTSCAKQMKSLIVKSCIKCGTTNTYRWYSGPTCNTYHGRNFRLKNPEYHRAYQGKKYAQDSLFREKDSLRKKKLYVKNKADIILKKRLYQKHKLQHDVMFKIKHNLRSRLN